ncbi:MAG: hypothetical protein M0R23_08900 [Bacteroidales bacterium]|jgi:hypothetical protein|nr:hypothetical protein [Bacteroidales bacterium]
MEDIKKENLEPVNVISEELKKEKVNEIKDKMKEAMSENMVESLLPNSEVEFEYEGKEYRVRKVLYKERQELYQKRAEKHLELLTNSSFMPEENIIKEYKKKDIDINELDKTIRVLQHKKEALELKLGKAIKDKAPLTELKPFRDEIENLKSMQQDASIKKTNYLSYSLEAQVNTFAYSYLVYLSAEVLKKEEGEEAKWVRVWSNYDDFLNSEEDLINILAFRVTLLNNPSMYQI